MVQVQEEWRDPGGGPSDPSILFGFGRHVAVKIWADPNSKTLHVHTWWTSLKNWDPSDLSDEFGHLRDGVEQAQFMEFVTNNG
ncbi:hypothetical protein LIER_24528 [Lithospermum erythrorhizon]|uniref:Uncharacterized protein n=1 Tax=Lithospermum erythrorhizon TaxID=34254 RepID=A0AAV3R2X6_LITER